MGKFYKNISGTYTIHRDLRNGILCLPNATYIPKHTNPSLAILEYVEGFLEVDTPSPVDYDPTRYVDVTVKIPARPRNINIKCQLT